MICRLCSTSLGKPVLSLGKMPLANSFLRPEELAAPEPLYPLDLYLCENCFLVQLEACEVPEKIFGDYAYFSSYSKTWLDHAGDYAREMMDTLNLGSGHLVVEVASNDGYLLKNFKECGVPVLGIEPARNVARYAIGQGIPTLSVFFGAGQARRLASEEKTADLLVANNVLAHVPDLHDFVDGLRILLKAGGVLTIEFQHLLSLIEKNQFDTIYHEHVFYFSFRAAERILAEHGLKVHDVKEISTHGGSLRLYVAHADDGREPSERIFLLREKEERAGLFKKETYAAFRGRVEALRENIRRFIADSKKEGKRIVGYGAPAKGNTLLNYCGVGKESIDYTVDRNVYKQGRYLPGSRIPIDTPERICRTRPDYVLLFPWNLEREVVETMGFIREWGGRFVVPIPDLHLV